MSAVRPFPTLPDPFARGPQRRPLIEGHDSRCPADPYSDFWSNPSDDAITDLIYKGHELSQALCNPLVGGAAGWLGVNRDAFEAFARLFDCRCEVLARDRREDAAEHAWEEANNR